MRFPIVRVLVVGALAGGTSIAYALSTGAPTARTGAPAFGGRPAENTCATSMCHSSFPLNSGPGMIEILDVPEFYALTQTYTLRVRVTHPQPDSVVTPLWGFEITAARADSGLGVGTFVLPPPGPAPDYPESLQFKPSTTHPTRQYVTHTTGSKRAGNRTSAEWLIDWISPSEPKGLIYFFAAGNAANGSGSNSGDYIYATSDSSDVGLVGVPTASLAAGYRLSAPHPNPSQGKVELSYAIARPGFVDLAIFDLTGRRIRNVVHGYEAAGAARARWDGRRSDGGDVPNGVYFARLRSGGQTLMRRIQIAH